MNRILTIGILFIILSGITSCKKEFLDKTPQTAIAPSQFFNTEQDLSLYINGLLNMADRNAYLSEQNSDNMATSGAVEVKVIMTGTPTAQNITSGWSWSRLRDYNYFLDNYKKAVVDSAAKDHYAGLARYYRATFYMDMVKRYSDVPWYSHTLNPSDTALYKARDPRALVMDSVMADLEFAAAHVRSEKDIPNKIPAGTPGQWAVKLFYARTALYEGTYRKYHPELKLTNTATTFLQKASDVAKDIITSGKYTLYNTNKTGSDYATLFNSQDLTSNPEVLLTCVYDVTKKIDGNNNTTVFGNYEQSPSRDLLQTYLMQDGTRFTDQPGYQTYSFVQEFQGRDPRLSQTLAYPGWIQAPNTVPYVQILSGNFTGYHQLKGYINSTDANIIGGADFPAYRYAEALLIYAEAQAELGAITQGDLDLSTNLLRARAGLPSLDMIWANGHPDPVLQAEYPAVGGADAGVLLEIRRERRVELALEGFRYDDLMRWGAGKLLTNIPQGMYFPGLGKFDLTGDGIEDIYLIDKDAQIPATKEQNSLGQTLAYYKTGTIQDGVTVALQNGSAGGPIITESALRTFLDPKYYYRPIPATEMLLNPNLKQIFGW